MYQKLNTERFIEKATKIHKDSIDYSNTTYVNSTTKISLKCKICEFSWLVIPSNHLNGTGCPKCANKKRPQNQPCTYENFIIKTKIIHQDKYEYLSTYINAQEKIKIKCNLCSNIFYQTPHHHTRGAGCPKCKYKFLLPQNRPETINEFENRCKILHKDKYEYCQDYEKQKNKIRIFCKKHKKWFTQAAYAHLRGQGCPICNFSKGELKIKEFLENEKIIFQTQKTFKNCKKINKLRFDFYIENENLCIEYNGEQHYYEIPYWGGEKHLKLIQSRDEEKLKFCKKENIQLLIIPFFEYDNINLILNNYLDQSGHTG